MATIWDQLTVDNLRVLVSGLAVAALFTTTRIRPVATGFAAPALGLFITREWYRTDWGWSHWVTALAVGAMVGFGYERLARSHRPTVAPATLLVCCGGVWLGVPENDPALALIGVVVGLVVFRRASDRRIGHGLGMFAVVTVVFGAVGRDHALVGGLVCLAPLAAVAVTEWMPRPRWAAPPPVFLVGAALLSLVAARWVGVVPGAPWVRVGVLLVGSLVLAAVTRPTAAGRARSRRPGA